VRDLTRTLKSEQQDADLREGIEPSPPIGSPLGTPAYIPPPWDAERAAAMPQNLRSTRSTPRDVTRPTRDVRGPTAAEKLTPAQWPKSALGSFASLGDQAKWGAEAVEAFLPIAKQVRGRKDDDPNLYIHIDTLALRFCWRFIKAKKDHTTMEALDNVVPLRRPESKKPAEPNGLLKLTWIHETEDDDERKWLVYGMFAKGEMSVIFGEPSAGKSIIAGVITLHVAHGMP
jgi:AAA domain